MAPGGVLVLSFPCLNSEDSPDQLRFDLVGTAGPGFECFKAINTFNSLLQRLTSLTALPDIDSINGWYAVDSFCFADSLIDSFGSFYLQSVKD